MQHVNLIIKWKWFLIIGAFFILFTFPTKIYLQNREVQNSNHQQDKTFHLLIEEMIILEQSIQKILLKNSETQSSLNTRLSNKTEKLDSIKALIHEIAKKQIEKNPALFEKDLKVLLTEYNHSTLLLELLGDLYQSLKNTRLAKINYKKTLSLKPGSKEVRLKLARVCEESGDLKTAFRLYRICVESDPDNHQILQSCIETAEKCNRLNDLANRWEKLLRVHREYTLLTKYLISVWNQLGRNDKVLELLNTNQ